MHLNVILDFADMFLSNLSLIHISFFVIGFLGAPV